MQALAFMSFRDVGQSMCRFETNFSYQTDVHR
jgi:hypothetical protein